MMAQMSQTMRAIEARNDQKAIEGNSRSSSRSKAAAGKSKKKSLKTKEEKSTLTDELTLDLD